MCFGAVLLRRSGLVKPGSISPCLMPRPLFPLALKLSMVLNKEAERRLDCVFLAFGSWASKLAAQKQLVFFRQPLLAN